MQEIRVRILTDPKDFSLWNCFTRIQSSPGLSSTGTIWTIMLWAQIKLTSSGKSSIIGTSYLFQISPHCTIVERPCNIQIQNLVSQPASHRQTGRQTDRQTDTTTQTDIHTHVRTHAAAGTQRHAHLHHTRSQSGSLWQHQGTQSPCQHSLRISLEILT